MIDTILSKRGAHKIIRTGKELSALVPTSIFSMDIETAGADDLPGDAPSSKRHGIAGIALANLYGDAAYIVVNDGREAGGLDLAYVIQYLNNNWMRDNCIVTFHNCKFDLGFLMRAGLDISRVSIRDTWMINSLLCEGVFTSNKLKDIMKAEFGLDVDTETQLKKWLEEHKTMDYGKIPVEIMAPYACDDVRYGLALCLKHMRLAPELKAFHDRYLANTLHLIAAERLGILVNVDLMKKRMTQATAMMAQEAENVRREMGSAQVDVSDDQAMLKFLHGKGLHPGPREMYGESKYFLDDEFMKVNETPLTRPYFIYAKMQKFIKAFGTQPGCSLWCRVEAPGVVHPSYLLSVFGAGGVPICKQPDFNDGVKLRNELRSLFVARPGKVFVVLRAMDLHAQIFGFYLRDKVILDCIGQGGMILAEQLATRNKFGPIANSLLLRKEIEGSGMGLLQNRLKAAGVRFTKNGHFDVHNAFKASLHEYTKLLEKLETHFRKSDRVQDRAGRWLRIPTDKRWRAVATLIRSSFGGIVSFYMDLFCRAANKTQAQLVMAHQGELVFEIDKENKEFVKVVAEIAKREIAMPVPKWLLTNGAESTAWQCAYIDAHDLVTVNWY